MKRITGIGKIEEGKNKRTDVSLRFDDVCHDFFNSD